jgi:hypothetical protein
VLADDSHADAAPVAVKERAGPRRAITAHSVVETGALRARRSARADSAIWPSQRCVAAFAAYYRRNRSPTDGHASFGISMRRRGALIAMSGRWILRINNPQGNRSSLGHAGGAFASAWVT